MKQKEIYRTATFAWSQTSTLPFVATGTVAGALDESFSNESQLEIWQPDFMNKDEVYLGADVDSKPKGVVTDTSRFNRIAWGQVQKGRSHGVIAAGMENGELALWDPEKIIAQADASDAIIMRNTNHTGPIRGLDFNPIQVNLLSSGAVSGEVFIWDLNDPSKPYSPTPGNRSSKLDEITSVAWNQQVQYVLAGASSSGYSVVWDLRGKREVVALAYGGGAGTLGGTVGSGMAVGGRRGMSAIAWHPDNATRLVTASEDDMSPVIMVWDLRNARAPEKILTGHEKGVLSLSWCKHDADLLLSCGKDNRALCWNPQTSEIIGELPSADNWAFQVEWCPRNPDLLATAFFSGTIGIHSLQSTNTTASSVPATPRPSGAELFDAPLPPIPTDQATHGLNLSLKQPPRWLRRPVSASFGFGGTLATVSNLPGAHGKTQSSIVHLRGVSSEETVVERVKKLRAAEKESTLEGFAQGSIEGHSGSEETWKALLSLFRSNSREELVMLLGYSKEEVKARIEEAATKLKETQVQQTAYGVPTLSYTADEPNNLEPRDPVVSFADPEPEPEVDAADTEKTGSEMSTSDIPPADGESTTTAPSLFGDDAAIGTFAAGTGADFFSTMATTQDMDNNETGMMVVPHTNYGIDSSVAATIGSGPSSIASENMSVKNNTFRIYPTDESETDRLITRALVLGDFSSAVELCLSAERYADALLLSIKGGDDLLQRTQKAYFENRTTEHPYLRLFQSIVANDLDDVVQNADLTEWAEVFVVLCTFASGDEFAGLAEQLGARLEFQAKVIRSEGETDPEDNLTDALELRKTATLTYLAAGRLERLVNIWIEELAEEEAHRIKAVDSFESTSRYAAHAHALQTFIEKVAVFRGAVKYVDGDLSVPSASADETAKSFKLAALYDRYFEYAEMLAAQGLVKEAVDYLKLTPEGYTGSALDFAAVRERLLVLSGQARTSSSVRDVVPNATTTTTAKPGLISYQPPSIPVSAAPLHGRYNPAPQPTYPMSTNPYTPPQTVAKPPLLGGTAPPSTRPPLSSAPLISQNGGWNDAPAVKQGRASTPSGGVRKLGPIVSPFPNPNVGAAQSPPTPSTPYAGHGHGQGAPVPPPPRPASVQNQPTIPPPPPRAGPPQARSASASNPPGTQYTSPSLGNVPLGQAQVAPYAGTPPPAGQARAPLGPSSHPYARATPPPGAGAGPYAPPPSSQVPQPDPYAPPSQVSQPGPYAPPQGQGPAQGHAQAHGQGPQATGPGSYAPPSAQASQAYAPPPVSQVPAGPGPYGPPPATVSMQGPPMSRGPPPPGQYPQPLHSYQQVHPHPHQHPHQQSPHPHSMGGMPSQSHGPPPPGGSTSQTPSASARVAAPPRGPPPPKYPPGDRTHIPDSALPIYTVLSEQLVHLKQTAPPQQKRMVEDLERRINPLFDALNCETLSKPVVDQLHNLVQAIAARDRELALGIHVDLLTRGSQTDDIGLWMSGIKQLIGVCL